MRKLILTSLIFLLSESCLFPQVKINLSLGNFQIQSGLFVVDVRCTVLPGQQWRVGSSNIRVDFITRPDSCATVHPDNPAVGGLLCICGNANYSNCTTTSISGGSAISFNIARLGSACPLSPGTYVLGKIRFNVINPLGCIRFTIRTTSVIQDSITQWLYPADWTTTVDTNCYPGPDGIRIIGNEIPAKFELYQNYPNPFNPATTIKFDIAKSSDVKLIIYDLLGKKVSGLVDERMNVGRYEVLWNAAEYASGTYFYKLQTESFTNIKKMTLIK